MAARFAGRLSVGSGRFAIVVARFNELVTERLLAGALDALHRHGVADDDVDVATVPCSFEIPLVARRLAVTHRYAAVVCLGAVIRGETPHFDHVANQAAAGVARASYDTGVPVVFGVLTTDTVEQALDRAGVKSGNKGFQAAVDAIEMADLLRQLTAKAQNQLESAGDSPMRSRGGWFGDDSDSLLRLIIRFVVNALAIWIASHVITGITPLNPLTQPLPLLVVALIFGIVNALIKPVFQFITCPLELLSLGLFTLIINAAMLGLTSWIAEQVAIPFRVDGFIAAFLGAIVISIVSWLLTRLV